MQRAILAFLFPVLIASVPQGQREATLTLIARDYAKAVTLLEQDLVARRAEPGAKGADRVLFLLANTRFLAGEVERAAADFARLEEEFPKSAYLYVARFGRARALARGRDFQQAAGVYRDEVARLLSPERRVRLSETYLELCDKALRKDTPDRKAAIQFVDLAVGLELPRTKQLELQTRAAKLAFEDKDFAAAAGRFEAIVKDVRGEVFADEESKRDSAFEERLWLARAWRNKGQPAEARRLLEDLLREGIDKERAPLALFELALCHGVPDDVKQGARGADLLQRFLTQHPDDERAPEAAYLLARTQANLGRLEEALKTADQLIERYAERKVDQVAQATADRGVWLSRLERFDEAVAAWQQYLSRFPAHGRWVDAQRAVVDLELAKADWLRGEGKARFDDARRLYEAFLLAHPLDPRCPDVYLLLGKMEEEREKPDDARRDHERTAAKFPGTNQASEAQYRIGFLYESKLFNYPLALESYRKVAGSHQPAAQQRIAVLNEKSLTLKSERTFRTDEKARIKLSSRNVPKLRVRVYKLDVETFVRATLGLGDVANLAIEVISPDQSFESAVHEYQPHKETEREVEVPGQGPGATSPGAYVVKVDDGELEATALVLVSDLVLVSKSSRRELFVFTENARQQAPQAGAKVFVTDGTKVLAEGMTDERGSWRYVAGSAKDLENTARLYVFARAQDGSGATTLDLGGLNLAQGLVARAFLYTDRSIYRPGETCGVRAVVRDVAAATYTVPKERAYRLEWIDGQGRLLTAQSLELSDFGTLAATFDVPAQAAPGTFALRLVRPSDQSLLATANVTVAEFTPPRVSLAVESVRTVLVRGERIEGKVVARYFFGGPVAGKRVEIAADVEGRRLVRGVTDKAGELAFSFETSGLVGLEGGRDVSVQATMAEEQASAGETYRIEGTELALGLHLPGSVWVAGDEIEAKVRARSHEDKPLSRALTAELFRLVTVAEGRHKGNVQELPAGKAEVTTDAKSGEATLRFKLEKGGNHRLRAWCVDRLGNRIEARGEFFVSGADDTVKLRLLSEAQHGKVGDTLVLRAVNRVGRKLCLITTEGDGVLAFETRLLEAGETKIELPLAELHAPNFAYALTLPDDGALFEARKEFVVERPLSVEVKPLAARVAPGGKLTLEVSATDSKGKPVEGEFSIAIVDQAILDLFPDESPDLYQVFWGPSVRRVTELRTAGSSTFRYEAATHRVNQELKREEKLREVERAAELARAQWQANLGDVLRVAHDGQPAPKPETAVLEELSKDVDKEAYERGAWNDTRGGGGGAGGKFGSRKRSDPEAIYVGRGGHSAGLSVMDLNGFGQGTGPRFSAFSEDRNQLERGILVGGQARETAARSLFADVAVWRAAVRTDASGKGRVEVDMPARDGSWAIRARGVTKDTLCGEAKSSAVTAKELLLRPALPWTLTEGDKPQGSVEVHNLAEAEADVEIAIKAGKGEPATGKARVPGKGSVERPLTVPTDEPGTTSLELSAKSAAGASDRIEATLTIEPWGIEERAARAGLLSGDESFRLELPAGDYRSRSLVLELGPDTLESMLPSGTPRERLSCNAPTWVPPTHGNRAGTGLAALALWQHLGKAGPGERGALARLRATVEATIASLQSAEAGGEVAWIGKSGQASKDPRSSALAWRFLVLARRAGFAVDALTLQRFAAKLPEWLRDRDLDLQVLAFLAHAEDLRGGADFARFNTLYRGRRGMSLRAKGGLVLAALAMERPGLVSELLPEIAEALRPMLAPSANAKRPVEEPQVETALWGLVALVRAEAHPEVVQAGETWLHAQRRPWGFANAVATALSIEFLAARRTSVEQLAGQVEVEVNGKFKSNIELGAALQHKRIEVPAEALETGANRITLRSSGRGRVVWSALLSGLTRGIAKERLSPQWISRTYLQPPAVLDGVVLPEGFACVDGRFKTWRNEATEVAVGGSAQVELRWHPNQQLQERAGSVVVEEPLPAGAMVQPGEVSGNFDHVEIGRGFLRFFLHRSRWGLQARYTLRGVVPGVYRVLPSRVFSLDAPDVTVYGPSAEIKVLAADAAGADQRRPTPDELYARGTRLFDRMTREALASDAAARDAAERELAALWQEFAEHLREQQFREVARRLLRLALAKSDHERTVRMFEALKDRDPDWVLGFEDMARVGASYNQAGEFEQSVAIYQAIAETAFLREVQIAGTLDGIGEFKASVDFMESLFWSFPGVPTVRGALYALAQNLNRKAGDLERSGGVDPKAGAPLELKKRARDLCYEFLLRYPEDADADEVVFTLASVALEAEQVDEALELLARAQRTYAESVWLDDFLYLEGYARFQKGERDQALALLKRVAEEDFPLGEGRKGKSDSQWLAVFLMGQIHHAAGRPGEALVHYEKVEKQFPDAREAADWFRAKRLSLPEVSLLKPNDPSKVKLSWRNLERVSLAVYKVDLMRLYLMRKSLSDMGEVQLFGIAPVHEEVLELAAAGSGTDYVDHDREIDLPVVREAGAYLVLARSGELKSSGLLLRSDLELAVQELGGEGRLRVHVKRGGLVVPKAMVKVVGDRDGQIRTGKTDLRGIYVADSLVGKATVLAKLDDAYAFFRGTTDFGPPPGQPQQSQQVEGQLRLFDALEQNDNTNLQNAERRQGQLKQLYKNTQQGVEIRRVK